MAQYSISQAARLLEIHRATLHRWIEKRLVPQPVTQEIAGSQLRYWTEEGLARLREYKAQNYRKKPRRKANPQVKRPH
jgi:DNA-binding transcriptional MerR regulator